MDTTNEITPADSVVPVYLEPVDETRRAQILAEHEDFMLQNQIFANARQSAIGKLEALGLTQEEINALTGAS
jgi:hypothetical protein